MEWDVVGRGRGGQIRWCQGERGSKTNISLMRMKRRIYGRPDSSTIRPPLLSHNIIIIESRVMSRTNGNSRVRLQHIPWQH